MQMVKTRMSHSLAMGRGSLGDLGLGIVIHRPYLWISHEISVKDPTLVSEEEEVEIPLISKKSPMAADVDSKSQP